MNRTTTKKGRPLCKKHEAEVRYVREFFAKEVKEGRLRQKDLSELLGRDQGNISRFLKGRSRLDDEAIETAYGIGILRRPILDEILPNENQPLPEWNGETKTTAEAAYDKGLSAATIRSYTKKGKLNFVRKGRRIIVVVDDKYKELPETEVARLRKEVAALKEENARIKEGFPEVEASQETDTAPAGLPEGMIREEALKAWIQDRDELVERLMSENTRLKEENSRNLSDCPNCHDKIFGDKISRSPMHCEGCGKKRGKKTLLWGRYCTLRCWMAHYCEKQRRERNEV